MTDRSLNTDFVIEPDKLEMPDTALVPDREAVKRFEAQRGIDTGVQHNAHMTDYRAAMLARAEGKAPEQPTLEGSREAYLAEKLKRANGTTE